MLSPGSELSFCADWHSVVHNLNTPIAHRANMRNISRSVANATINRCMQCSTKQSKQSTVSQCGAGTKETKGGGETIIYGNVSMGRVEGRRGDQKQIGQHSEQTPLYTAIGWQSVSFAQPPSSCDDKPPTRESGSSTQL